MDSFQPSYVALVCFACGREHERTQLQTVCRACGKPLEARIDVTRAGLRPEALRGRERSLWRWAELLPIAREHAVSLGEGGTPLIRLDAHTFVKDEAQNPTGSFKARGMTMAVSAAKALGARALRAPSAGNAAGALAAYGAAAGLPVTVAMPSDTPRPFIDECKHYGATVHLVDGTISDCGRFLAERGPADAFDVSTLKEPFRIEGKKTMGYELWEDFGGQLPDVVMYPTGGGTGLVGMWKAWNELEALGWIGAERPRLVSVQAAGCAPVVEGFARGAEATVPWLEPRTAAWGLRVPAPIGGFLCLRALRATSGHAVAVDETDIAPAAAALAARSGIDICPESGAAWAATQQLRDSGWIRPTDRVVLFNTGTGLKYR